jgi:DNA-directed RNA polymerase subunit RPC12/RpoP
MRVDAQIRLSIEVECPYCDEYIELLQVPRIADDGYIYSKAFGDNQWGCENFNEKITCTDCKKEFTVENINY